MLLEAPRDELIDGDPRLQVRLGARRVTPVRNRVAALACTPALLATPFRPVRTCIWSLKASIGLRMRVVSKPRPSAAGVKCFIAMPFGT